MTVANTLDESLANGNSRTPLVSVLMLTFNHERFVRQAVASAVAQETGFAVEIVVGDDCSTDTTPDILRELAALHPDKLRLILRPQNVGVNRNFTEMLHACRGKYIAILEGDDYWLYPGKLQAQVDLLECNPHLAACHHNAFVQVDDDPTTRRVWHQHPLKELTQPDVLKTNPVVTCSVLFRSKFVLSLPACMESVPLPDWTLHIFVSGQGRYAYLDRTWGVYRLHPTSYWSSRPTRQRQIAMLRNAELILPELSAESQRLQCSKIQSLKEQILEELILENANEEALCFADEQLGNRDAYQRLVCYYEGLLCEEGGHRLRAIKCWLKSLRIAPSRTRIRTRYILLALFRVSLSPLYHLVRGSWRFLQGRDQHPIVQVDPALPLVAPGSRGWLARFDIDRAVLLSISSRLWQIVAGPVTVWLIAHHITAETQGFYYTFGSILAMQMFFELGLSGVIVNLASHEWARLRLTSDGHVDGDIASRDRLANLLRRLVRWYQMVAIAFAASVTLAGFWFFREESGDSAIWLGPWLSVVALTACNLSLIPRLAILEGCHQVETVGQFRLLQVLMVNAVAWLSILFGGELWTLAFAAGTQLAWQYLLIHCRYRCFFQSLAQSPQSEYENWNVVVWPMQWRVAMQTMTLWFGTQLFTPIMFHYHGKDAAGRMGMTWSVLAVLQALGQSWIQARTPQFGSLVAERRYAQLDQLMRRTVVASGGSMFLAAGVFMAVVASLPWIDQRIASRFLDLLPASVLALTVAASQIIFCQGTYIRAHNRDPFVWMAVSSNLACGLLVWWWGGVFGPLGAAIAYFVVVALYVIPISTWIWSRCRREWHQTDD